MKVLRRVRQEIGYYRAVARHPRTPRAARWLIWIALAYLVSPVDLIPDAIPVLGLLDDLLLVPGLIALAVLLVPAEVRRECRAEGLDAAVEGPGVGRDGGSGGRAEPEAGGGVGQ